MGAVFIRFFVRFCRYCELILCVEFGIIIEINKSRFERRSKMPYITIESGVLTDAQKEQLIKRLQKYPLKL